MIIREQDISYYNSELYHFGVLGMKWGHRKSQIYSMSSSKRKSAKQKYKSDMKKSTKDYRKQKKRMKTE